MPHFFFINAAKAATSSPSAVAIATTTNIYNDFATNVGYINTVLIIGGSIIVLSFLFLLLIFAALPQRTMIGSLMLVAGLCFIAYGIYQGSIASKISPVFSKSAMLASLWSSYTEQFVQAGTNRTIDPSQNSITTSEGESYTMLRAVWEDDQPVFDASWSWTRSNLQHSNDHLFSWLYGKEPQGSYGVLTTQGGQNSASDADSDIALALVFAYSRWQQPQYLADARAVINDIWNKEVVTVNGQPYLAADNIEKNSTSPIMAVDVSYFSPYSYRVFAAVDPSHPWNTLLNSMYRTVQNSMTATLNGTSTANLPPDWIGINKNTGALVPWNGTSSAQNYGYDAMRTPWRLALDWQWNHDPRDHAILNQMGFLATQWDSRQSLLAVYGHNGSFQTNYEAPAVYGGDIGYFLVSDPNDAQAVYDDKLLILYDPDAAAWKIPLSYYDSNWAWFGIALYNDALPNLASGITMPPTARIPASSNASSSSQSSSSLPITTSTNSMNNT